MDSTLHDDHSEIARLERAIEKLTDAGERCRKIDLGAKAAMAAGGFWLLAVVVGLGSATAATTLLAIAAVVGGLVLFGSNQSSWTRFSQQLEACRARREHLIDNLHMTTVKETSPTPSDRWLH